MAAIVFLHTVLKFRLIEPKAALIADKPD